MPTQIQNKKFIDVFGVETSQFIANAGDKLVSEILFRTSIRITTINNPLSLDVSLNAITSPTIGWLDEGFRVGDWCLFLRYDSNGTLLNTFYSKIEYVDNSVADFTSIPVFYDITNLETLVILALDFLDSPIPPPLGFQTPRPRADMNILVNQCLNSVSGQPNSLIDGEQTDFLFLGVETMNVLDVINGISIPNQSGQFVESMNLERLSNTNDGFLAYKLTIVFIQSGPYNSNWFFTNECLKFFTKFKWKSIPNDGLPFETTIIDENGNTGWFNQSHNSSPSNSVLVSGTSNVDYISTTNHTIIVDGPIDDIGIGGCYISTNDLYYKNQTRNQNQLTMLIPTSDVSGLPFLNSELNPFLAGYDIDIKNVSVLGSQTTIEFDFIPNVNFGQFMSNVNDGDRLFYIWVKCGNINHLVFADQLFTEPAVGGALEMNSDFGFMDHSENVDEQSGNNTGFEANTEDDISYFGTFRLTKNEIIDSFSVSIEAFNDVTFDSFTLQQTTFVFSGVQISNDGRYLLNETQNIVSTLPNNSEKRNAKLKLRSALDVANEYGVEIYFPFLLRWEYWLEQLNANVDFYPTQNRNWEQYDNQPNWNLRLKLSLVKNGLAFIHTNQFINKNYDSDPNIIQSIELFIDATNQNIGVVTEGEQMRVVATNELVSGTWNAQRTWGMITIEPTESSPRFICSSILPFDNNQQNPLVPLNGVQMVITYPQPNIAQMECFFDPEKINLSNGVKFTCKIKQKCDDVIKIIKMTTDNELKMTTNDFQKIIS